MFLFPQRLVEQLSAKAVDLERRLGASIKDQEKCYRQQLKLLEEKLNAFDPEQVLKRGYSLTLNAEGRPVVSCQTVHADDKIQTWLSDGRLASRVEEVEAGLNYVEHGEKKEN